MPDHGLNLCCGLAIGPLFKSHILELPPCAMVILTSEDLKELDIMCSCVEALVMLPTVVIILAPSWLGHPQATRYFNGHLGNLHAKKRHLRNLQSP
jgi:hypothetical protein